MIVMIRSENSDYQTKGISALATILEKRKIDDDKSSKHTKFRYVFRVSYFTNPENIAEPITQQQDSLRKAKSDIENTIDDIFGDVNRDRFGDYTSTELNVPAEIYNKYLVGDNIPIIYLSDKHEKIKLDTK